MSAKSLFSEGLRLCERIQEILATAKADRFLEQGDDSLERIKDFGELMMKAYGHYKQFVERVLPLLNERTDETASLYVHALRAACVQLGALNGLPETPSILRSYPRQKQLGNAQEMRKTVAELLVERETRVKHVIEMLHKTQQHLEDSP